MFLMKRSVITGTGAYIPSLVKANKDFVGSEFYSEQHEPIGVPSEIIVEKFKAITGIQERRYAESSLSTSDMAALASKEAIQMSGVDPETIDQIIVAHNFGDIVKGSIQSNAVPALASRVKHLLGIKNPSCIAYDLLFGCPGWLQGVIQADAFFKAGVAHKALIIGAETLSRIIDTHDRDSMIFSDGAGACILEYKDSDEYTGSGILGSSVQSHCNDEAYYINMGCSYLPGSPEEVRYIKMKGRKVYEYAVKHVPIAMKECLDKNGIDIKELKKVFIHQANEKMDEAMMNRLYKSYNAIAPEHIMPMSIHWLGNSSVATIPTLLDLVLRGKQEGHTLTAGDVVLFASVGAGMNINAVAYRM